MENYDYPCRLSSPKVIIILHSQLSILKFPIVQTAKKRAATLHELRRIKNMFN